MIIFIFELQNTEGHNNFPRCLQVPGFAAPWHPGASHGRMQIAGFEGKPQVPLVPGVPVGWQWNPLSPPRNFRSEKAMRFDRAMERRFGTGTIPGN